MAFIAERSTGLHELRESRHTARGPRSRTLARFRVLDRAVLREAAGEAQGAVDDEVLLAKARARGLVTSDRRLVDRLARELLTELERGDVPDGAVGRLLVARLTGTDAVGLPDTVGPAAEWLTAGAAQRGRTLRDLLALADRVPRGRAPAPLTFPRLDSTTDRD